MSIFLPRARILSLRVVALMAVGVLSMTLPACDDRDDVPVDDPTPETSASGDTASPDLAPGDPNRAAADPSPSELLEETPSIPRHADPPELAAASDFNDEQEPQRLRAELAPYFQLIRRGDYGAARVRLRKHLILSPEDGQAQFLFGLTYHQEKHYAKALPWYEKAIEHERGYDPTWYFLGWAQFYLGEPEEARQAFEHHLTLRPDEGDTHFGLGLIALDQDRLDDAQDRFERSIALHRQGANRDRDLSKALVNLAEVHLRRDEYEQARDKLIEAGELFPEHYEAFYKLSLVYARLGEMEEAAAARQKFVETREQVEGMRGGRAEREEAGS